MSSWDELSPEQKQREAARNRRYHGSINRAQQLAIADASLKTVENCIAYLDDAGFPLAARALESELFGSQPASPPRAGPLPGSHNDWMPEGHEI